MKIKLSDIAKIQSKTIRIFEEQNSDYCDGRVVANLERSINNCLAKITSDKDKQSEILDVIESYNFYPADYTFKPICDKLRALGYEVEE